MGSDHNYVSDEMLAAFLDGNVSGNEAAQILDAIATDSEAAEILGLSADVDREVELEERRILPMWALAAANPENLCSFDCETYILNRLGFDIDSWTLLETAKANNWVREEGTPLHHVGRLLELKGLHVERKYDADIDDLAVALKDGREVIAVVDKDVLDGRASDCKRPSYHAIYITSADGDTVGYLSLGTLSEESVDAELFRRAWKCSGNYMVTATMQPNGYNPQPIDVADIDLDADLLDLTEAIAENAHDTWARARMDEGWTYGPVRDDARRQHPDLIPYAQLPDSEKEYDRIMAMNTLRLVKRLGFEILNTNKD